MKRILIKNGTVVTNQTVSQMDVLIEGEQIAAIGNIDAAADMSDIEIDALGFLVLPGAVDSHVHFNDVFMNTVSVHDYYTGTLAAAFGGVTSVIDFSNQEKGKSLLSTIETKKQEAAGLALVDWGVHPVITDPTDETLAEIPLVVEQGAPTIKCYMTYRDEGLLIEINDLKRISKALHAAGGMLMVHAEDNDIIETEVPRMIRSGLTAPVYHAGSRPKEAENRAIRNCIDMVRETGGAVFVVHMATDDGVQMVKAARAEGLNVFAETCTHYLMFTDEMLKRDDGIKWICSPPLRDRFNREGLWKGVAEKTICMVTSDDAAYSWEAKLLGKDRFDLCPNGIPGIEPRLNLLYSEGVVKGRLSLPRLVEIVSSAPARYFGLAPRKGNLVRGADADIVLFDPGEEWVMGRGSLHMAADWSAYEGIRMKGRIKKVFSRGELIIDGDRCLAARGRGRYIYRKKNEK
ncbi:MAG: dihydropyrimidinase [bacterium]|nr:dihydropyrimidinase [bacterium]